MHKLFKATGCLCPIVLSLQSLCSYAFSADAFVNTTIKSDTTITVPLGGNAWASGLDTAGGKVTDNGIVDWTNPNKSFHVHVRFGQTGKIKLWLNARTPSGESKLMVSALGISKALTVNSSAMTEHYAGEWTISDTGYADFQIKGMVKSGTLFADINNLIISGAVQQTNFVKNDDGQFFYWGRRGPSVHLNYPVPDTVNAEWFYNEITVPPGNDVVGSYFMADGFGEGYFGMQVNSTSERRILFSVWSPFQTDDPKKIPDDQKILMLRKGPAVHTGEFGNEGAGGQSYLLYNWKAGNTYKFLIHAVPVAGNRTEYTAYFKPPHLYGWLLIASFSRPQTQTYLKHLHSFLENFEPETGETTRQALYGNQWIKSDKGQWIALNKARFTVDNTAVKGYRMDYAGGVQSDAFYLKNCGFFNHYTPRNVIFERRTLKIEPMIKELL